MKIIVLILLSFNISYAQSGIFENNSFNSTIDQFEGLKFKMSRGTLKAYNKLYDPLMSIYPLINEVVYVFINDTLNSILMKSASNLMLWTFEERFGSGKVITEDKIWWDFPAMTIRLNHQDGEYVVIITTTRKIYKSTFVK